jgi:hypothetical protein
MRFPQVLQAVFMHVRPSVMIAREPNPGTNG